MHSSLHILQANFRTGDLHGNAQRILAAAQAAHDQGVALLITPAWALCGGPTVRGLLHSADFALACQAAFERIVQASRRWPALTLIVGHPHWLALDAQACSGLTLRPLNAISAVRAGQVIARHSAQMLENTAVLHEFQHLSTVALESAPCTVQTADGVRWALAVGRDAWKTVCAKAEGIHGLIVCGAWDWVCNNDQAAADDDVHWQAQLQQCARSAALSVVAANLCGASDEHIFAGTSMVIDAQGVIVARAPALDDALLSATYAKTAQSPVRGVEPLQWSGGTLAPEHQGYEALWRALVQAVRDYVGKNRFPGALLGLSGGVDSALVLALAVDALGAAQVRTVMMPSPYTAQISLDDAAEMARRLGVRHDCIPIAPIFEAFNTALAGVFAGLEPDTTEENLQARSRGTLLMALSNKTGVVVLTTSNKSESAVGYSTLYGDMAGGFAPIRDLLKAQVFALAHWRNAHDPFGTGEQPIPERIITRAPSAELRPDQRDEDSLLPYPVLDDILARHLHAGQTRAQLIAAGHAAADVDKVLRLLRGSEYKRRQGPTGPLLHRSRTGAFGSQWAHPISSAFVPE